MVIRQMGMLPWFSLSLRGTLDWSYLYGRAVEGHEVDTVHKGVRIWGHWMAK